MTLIKRAECTPGVSMFKRFSLKALLAIVFLFCVLLLAVRTRFHQPQATNSQGWKELAPVLQKDDVNGPAVRLALGFKDLRWDAGKLEPFFVDGHQAPRSLAHMAILKNGLIVQVWDPAMSTSTPSDKIVIVAFMNERITQWSEIGSDTNEYFKSIHLGEMMDDGILLTITTFLVHSEPSQSAGGNTTEQQKEYEVFVRAPE